MTSPPPSEILRVTSAVIGGRAVVTLVGELDICAEPLVEAALIRCLDRRPHRIDLDLAGVTFCDASGLRTLALARRRARNVRSALRLSHVPPAVSRLFSLLGEPVWDLPGAAPVLPGR
jgi:anti-sigma B factor antagonist